MRSKRSRYRVHTAIFLAALVGVAFLTSYLAAPLPERASAPTNNNSEEQSEESSPCGNEACVIWRGATKDGITVFTGLLSIFTFALLFVSSVQIRYLIRADSVASRAADTSERALTFGQRAFVFPVNYEITKWQETATKKMLGIGVTLHWHNSGETPTKNLMSCLNFKIFPPAQSPEDTNFEDLSDAQPKQSMIGPKVTIASQTANVRPEDLEQIAAGTARFFAWGWVEYNDVFPNTKRRRTEVCHELQILGDLANPDAGTFKMRIYGAFNQADDDCQHAPKT